MLSGSARVNTLTLRVFLLGLEGCSDSHQFDAQAAAEAGANLAIAGLANASFVHNLGFLSGGRTGSLELLTLCDKMIGWTSKMEWVRNQLRNIVCRSDSAGSTK